ncbi:MAG: hypothetical protein JWQ43_2566 [Glaciihabitans sp.]|nr:hypothetical protein [Glaciihabitans sp.]
MAFCAGLGWAPEELSDATPGQKAELTTYPHAELSDTRLLRSDLSSRMATERAFLNHESHRYNPLATQVGR